ncbi:MAG: hypothetical protein AAFY25_06685 [Pseudomonadota bacterium]
MRDSIYFRSLMRAKAQKVYDELASGRSTSDLMEMEDEVERRTFMPRLEAEIGRNLPEARAMVEALEVAGTEPTPLSWVKIYPGYEYGQAGTARRTRAQMIERLEEIASIDLGDDIRVWQEWLAAFEADPPPRGYH